MSNRAQPKLNFVEGVYGDNWRKLREEAGKTVREFANQIFISHSTISSIENEKIYPTVEQVIQYQKEFNVSLDYLVGLTKTKDIDNNMITKYTGLSEDTIKYLHELDEGSKELLDLMICQTVSDNPLMEQEYSLFSRLIDRAIEYVENAVENELNRGKTIKLSELATIYGSDFGLYDDEKELQLRLIAKGYNIYKSETVLEAQLLETERLLSQILKSIVNDLVDKQRRSETDGTDRKEN